MSVVTGTTLTLLAEIVPTVHKGALVELELPVQQLSMMCESPDEPVRSEYEAVYPHLGAAQAFLGEVGYPTSEPSSDIQVDLTKHLWILLRVLRGQQRADIEFMDHMDAEEQRAATHRIQLLHELIRAAVCEG